MGNPPQRPSRVTVDLWSETVGEKPHRVTVFERLDKGMVIYLRWWVGGKAKLERAKVGAIRDSRARPSKNKQNEALAEAFAKIEELKGLRKPAKLGAGPLTLRDGIRLAFSDRGCYPHDPKVDDWTGDARRYAELAVDYLEGGSVRFEDVTPGMIRAVWRRMEKAGDGHDKATKTLIVFFKIAGWLEGEYQSQRFPRPPKGWRQELKEHWHKKGHDTTPFRPRHTIEEITLLFQNREKADPRIALALALGPELRGGQVEGAMRSHCRLKDGVWRIDIPSKSLRKLVPPLILNELEARIFEKALTEGYLSDLEAAFQAGRIKDFSLFPAGRLRKGKAVVERSDKPILSFINPFHDFEVAAGVTPVKGRGWHGVRRGMSDFYQNLIKTGVITDARILNQLQGWVPGSAMRERVYQDQESEELVKDASDARRFRPGLEG